jgi:oxygen-dependent protoporphyrinogen oxidase
MNVAVLGGGVTGLTAAWRLSTAGHSVRLFEAGARLGGSVKTEIIGGWTIEAGPNSFQETPEVSALVGELGLAAERIEALPGSKNRYIVLGGKLAALPSPPSALGLLTTPILSLGAKWRVARERSRKPLERAGDLSVGDFMRDHFGAEAVARVVQPFVGGIYAGDAERLSARYAFPRFWEAERTTGSLLRAGAAAGRKRRAAGLPASPAILSFRRGVQVLTDALAARLLPGTVALSAEVRSLGPGADRRWRVDWETAQGPRHEDFDCVVAALPAGSLARLPIGPEKAMPLSGLEGIGHPPVASVFVGFRRDQVRHPLDGFGALVPAAEKKSIMGILFTSSLFGGRAPAGHVAVTVLAGGVLQPEVARLAPDLLAERVLADLEALLGTRGQPAFLRQTLWKRAIPQYELGHGVHLEAMAACERAHPGLFIGGNARDGISLPDCLASGTALAQRVS